jgi:hypothetical protein
MNEAEETFLDGYGYTTFLMATQLSDGYTTPMATGWLQET